MSAAPVAPSPRSSPSPPPGSWPAAAARRSAAPPGATIAALSGGRARSFAEAALRLGIPQRLQRAGLAERVAVPAVLVAKLAGSGLGALAASSLAPVAPGRLALPVALALPAAGFLAPDALLEREARRRGRRLVNALPDALDLLAVGAAAGRSPGTVIGEIASGTTGPLAAELAVAVARIECGASQAEALEIASRAGPRRRGRRPRRRPRALAPLRLPARRPAARAGDRRCAATSAAASRSAPRRPRRRSSSSSPWSSSPRSS